MQELHIHGMLPGMSRPANPYDNATCESLIKTVKREEIRASAYREFEDLRQGLEEFIERYYNQPRKICANCGHPRFQTQPSGLSEERLLPKKTSVVRESLVQIRPPQLRLANKPVITMMGQRILFSARQHGPFWRRPKRLKPG